MVNSRVSAWIAVVCALVRPILPVASIICTGTPLQPNGTAFFSDPTDVCENGTLRHSYYRQNTSVELVTVYDLVCSNETVTTLVNTSVANETRLVNVSSVSYETSCTTTSQTDCYCAPGQDQFWPQGVVGPYRCCQFTCGADADTLTCGTWTCNPFTPWLTCTKYCCINCGSPVQTEITTYSLQNVSVPVYQLVAINSTEETCVNESSTSLQPVTTVIEVPQNCEYATYTPTRVTNNCTHASSCDTVDSHVCTCDEGWTGSLCSSNINECVLQFPCSSFCTDTQGSYTCSCEAGFVLAAPALTQCVDIDECSASDPPCRASDGSDNFICTNTVGGYSCTCPEGYARSIDTCVAGSCGDLEIDLYCPSGYAAGVNCSVPTVTCNSTSVLDSCTLTCPRLADVLEGPVTGVENTASNPFRTVQIPCQRSLSWGTHNRSWCRRYNTAPTGITMVGGTVRERARDVLVGTLVTTDVDVLDVHTYALTDSDSGRFELRNGNEVFCVRALDFETENRTSIVVTSTDKGNDTVTAALFIRVLDVPEAPTRIFFSSEGSVFENATAGTVVGAIGVDDEDIGDTHTIQVLVPLSHFTLSGDILEYRRLQDSFLNFEVAPNVTVTLRATDSAGLTVDAAVVVTILDANDAPMVMTSTVVADESAAVGSTVRSIAVYDEDNLELPYRDSHGQSFQLFLAPASLGAPFGFRNGVDLFVTQPLDFETQASYTVAVLARDNGSPPRTTATNVTVLVGNAEEAPVYTTLSVFSMNETVPTSSTHVGSTIATVQVYEEDLGESMNISTRTGSRFRVGPVTCTQVPATEIAEHATYPPGRQLQKCTAPLLVAAPVLYVATQGSIAVVLDMQAGTLSTPAAFTMTVLNVNEPPVDVVLSSYTVPENTPPGVLVAEVTATDNDGDTVFDFSLPGDLEDTVEVPFVLVGTELIVGAFADGVLDYEERASYVVLIIATDFGNPPLSLRKNVTISVINVNEAPSNITLSNVSFREDLVVNGSIAQIAVIDPDNANGDVQTHVCTCEDPSGNFYVDDENVLRLHGADIDYERQQVYRDVLITCTDSGTPPLALAVSTTLYVDNVNERPVGVVLSANTVRENSPRGTIVGTLTTADPDTLSDDVAVQAAFTYQFRTPAGTVCGSDRACPFAVEGSGLLVTTEVLNFEAQDTYGFTVVAFDPIGASFEQDIVVYVEDVNDAPTNLLLDPSTVIEGVLGAFVGNFTVADEDRDQTHWLQILDPISTDGGKFEIRNGHSLFLGASITADYEVQSELYLRVRAYDNGTPVARFVDAAFVVHVANVNERPTAVVLAPTTTVPGTSAPAVWENASVGDVLGVILVDDPDNTDGGGDVQVHTCAVTAVVPPVPSNLALIVDDAPDGAGIVRVGSGHFDYAVTDTYNITIACIDNGTAAVATSVLVLLQVLPINKAPTVLHINGSAYPATVMASTFSDPPPLYISENLAPEALVAAVVTEDPNNCPFARCLPLQTFAYSMSDSRLQSTSAFCISAENELIAVEAVDYETTPVLELYVNVTDSGVPAEMGVFVVAVHVLDANDPPRLVFEGIGPIAHNAVAGSLVGTLSVFDQDSPTSANGMHTLTIVREEPSSATPKFVLSGSTVRVAADASFTPEEDYYLGIQVEDHGSPPLRGYLEVTVVISAFNHAPSALVLAPSVTQLFVRENTTDGQTLVRVTVLDADNPAGCDATSACPQTHTCVARVTACFPPQPQGCVRGTTQPLGFHGTTLVVNDASQLDFERVSTFSVELACTDSGFPATPPATTTLTVTILDSNDAPFNIRVTPASPAPAGFSSGALVVPEHAPDGYVVGVVAADDADPGQTLSYGVGPVGGAAGGATPALPFALEGSRLVVRAADGSASPGLDFEKISMYTLALTAVDSGVPAASTWTVITVYISNVNEAPTGISYSCGCRGSPCQHGGACVGSVADPLVSSCSCNFGFTGAFCESSGDVTGVVLPPMACLVLGPTSPVGPEHALLRVAGLDPDADQHAPRVTITGTSSVFALDINGRVYLRRPLDSGVSESDLHLGLMAMDADGLSFNRTLEFTLSACGHNSCSGFAACTSTGAADSSSYTCTCQPGYRGDGYNCTMALCEFGVPCFLHTCAASPCANGGTCIDDGDASSDAPQFSCACADGFSGPTCDVDLAGCGGDVCVSGTCQVLLGNPFRRFACICDNASTVGAYCQYDTTRCDTSGCYGAEGAARTECIAMADEDSVCTSSAYTVKLGYRYPSCVVVGNTTVTACDMAWTISLADIEVFVAMTIPADCVFYPLRFSTAPTQGAATGFSATIPGIATDSAIAEFVVWNKSGLTPVPAPRVAAWIAGFCSNEFTGVVANPHLAGLCNFTQSGEEAPTSSDSGGSQRGSTIGFASTLSADDGVVGTTQEILVVDQQSGDATASSSGSTAAVMASIGIILCALCVILIAFVVRRRADRSASGGITSRSSSVRIDRKPMSFLNPSYDTAASNTTRGVLYPNHNDRQSTARGADSISMATDAGYLNMAIEGIDNGYLDIQADNASMHSKTAASIASHRTHVSTTTRYTYDSRGHQAPVENPLYLIRGKKNIKPLSTDPP
eukprot:m.104083 g.104083  ORF g.104083 m.104083 type:complete len:2579 (-) comp16843_c0_seq15:2298-10034(-)